MKFGLVIYTDWVGNILTSVWSELIFSPWTCNFVGEQKGNFKFSDGTIRRDFGIRQQFGVFMHFLLVVFLSRKSKDLEILWTRCNCITTPPTSKACFIYIKVYYLVPLFQGNLGWWNIIIWPDIMECWQVTTLATFIMVTWRKSRFLLAALLEDVLFFFVSAANGNTTGS